MPSSPSKPDRRRRARLAGVLALLLVGVPAAVFVAQARHSGLSCAEQWRQVQARLTRRSTSAAADTPAPASAVTRTGDRIPFLMPAPVGQPATDPPRIANLRVADVDRDGRLDVVVCDASANRVSILRGLPGGTFREETVAVDIAAPAHVEPYDIDADGDADLLVASMGMLFPNNDRIGSVVVLENTGGLAFTRRVAVEHIARVTDVRGGDLDGDGDADLAVGQFGYDDGEIRWLESRGGWTFDSHILLRLSGTIHTPVADLDGDGDLDIAALVSQEWEEVYVFENDGRGGFTNHLVYGSPNEDYGSSSIDLVDLDRDGDLDVLYTNGDAFDYIPPRPRPWHGVQWLENRGHLQFAFHRLGDVPGAAAARAVDVDHDGDLDVLVCSAYNQWERPAAYSLLWFENNGPQGFLLRPLARAPTHLITLDVGDMDGDGWVDVVTGGMHVYPPYDRLGRVTLWTNHWPAAAPDRRAPGSAGAPTPAAGPAGGG